VAAFVLAAAYFFVVLFPSSHLLGFVDSDDDVEDREPASGQVAHSSESEGHAARRSLDVSITLQWRLSALVFISRMFLSPHPADPFSISMQYDAMADQPSAKLSDLDMEKLDHRRYAHI
jgi:hypothetical protein